MGSWRVCIIQAEDFYLGGWCGVSFAELIAKTDMSKYGQIVPFETAQMEGDIIVPFEMAQIPNVLFATGWTNHQIILCKDADMEVVRYALNRSMSPTMVALYKEQLQVGGVIQRSLVEFCKFLKK